MPDVLPAFHAQEHFAAVVALLRAIELRASATFNGVVFGVQVELEDGREVVWSNYNDWACTLVQEDGSVVVHNSHLRADSPPDAVAHLIAFTDYDFQT